MDKDGSSIAYARSRIYQLLSTAFLYPDEKFYSSLKSGNFFNELNESLSLILEKEVKWIFRNDEILTSSFRELETEYVRVFGHTVSMECSPYETQYETQNIFQQTQLMGDIAGFYRAFGLEVSDEIRERLDHISVELEFMGFLAYKEAYAMLNHGPEKSSICRDGQRKFFNEHLGRWGSLFLKLLQNKAKGGFYHKLTSKTEEFFTYEINFLEVCPKLIQEFHPETFDPKEICFSCDK